MLLTYPISKDGPDTKMLNKWEKCFLALPSYEYDNRCNYGRQEYKASKYTQSNDSTFKQIKEVWEYVGTISTRLTQLCVDSEQFRRVQGYPKKCGENSL